LDSGFSGYRIYPVIAAFLLAAIFLFACDDLFVNDGDPDRGMNFAGGYYYFIDNTSYTLLMMDPRLEVIKSWDTRVLFEETSVQGITCDGLYLWLSAAGSTQDKIVQVDASGDELVAMRTLDAPPERHGTIRDLSWDGQFLWAVNSGSVSFAIPPTLYKLDPNNGTILEEHLMPTPEPRGMTYVGSNGDVYGRDIPIGFYYGDMERDTIYRYLTEKLIFEAAFASPIPPRGDGYVFPVGLTYDGTDLWVVNSSSLAGDHLFRVDRTGTATEMYELPYKTPGPIVWSPVNVSLPHPPVVTAVSPNTGARGSEMTVAVLGEYFRAGAGVSVGDGIFVGEVTVVSNTQLSVDIEVLGDAAFGSRDVTVTNADGQSGVGQAMFTVLEFDPNDGYFYYTDAGNRVLRKIKISDFSIIQSWDISGFDGGSPQGLTYDGTYLWMSAGGSSDQIMQIEIDGTSLSVLRQLTAPPGGTGTIREIDFLGDDLYAANDVSDYIYVMDSLTGALTDSIPTPGGDVRGVVFANGDLYCNDRTIDSVFVYDFGTEAWAPVFATPTPPGGTESNRYATGMTWDGINFWIVNSTGEYDYVFQMTLDGTVIRTYELPDRGTVTQPTGIVFTKD
jgi:hypothetical protein